MPKRGAEEEIKEYNRQKQAWHRAKKKGLGLTWEEWWQKSLTQKVVKLAQDVKLENVKLFHGTYQTNLEVSNLTADLSNHVKPESVLSNLVKPDQGVKSKLWLDYYFCKKPYCFSCIQSGIKEKEYVFCSEKLIAPRNYACTVKHWTIYQGHSYQKQPKNSLLILPLLALTQQVMKGTTI